ncbi:MAG: U32 family peptidase [Clostridia bacterium]|nr:U32 family peptidase [Clostridia bacterium]
MKQVEILAPVGNTEMLVAAVRSGADAVYLGMQSFNARRNAENFTYEQLEEAVEFCHIRGVKVYLTLNIIIRDDEMQSAISQTVRAAKAGIDGIITADIGFASAVHKVLPDLAIHASTQMTVHSPSALKPLREMGFSRVVVSREMSKTELEAFCKEAEKENIEVEVFVHGALCMSMSGQCLLSAILGGRSGNRGLCAGPCRLPFAAEGGNGYDLSLKDLSLIPYISELKDMGVSSFKIEGRMKRPEYVSAAVYSCRQMLDKGFVDEDIADALEKVFSRSGFTDGYYKNELGKGMFGIRTKEDVTSSDSVFARIHQLYRTERQSVALAAEAKIKRGEPLRFTVSDGVNTAFAEGEIPEEAIKRPIDFETVREQLSKTGGTPYFIKELESEVDGGLSVRMSELNSLRREALEEIGRLRAAKGEITVNKETEYRTDKAEKVEPKLKIYCRIESLSQLTGTVDMFILSFDIDPEKIPNDIEVPIAVELPRGISNEELVKARLKAFRQRGIELAFCSTLAAAELARGEGFRVAADFGFNTYNSLSCGYHSGQGAAAVVLSPEMKLNEAKDISSDIEKGIISYGRLPLMLTRNCPVRNGLSCAECKREKGLVDRKMVEFPIRCSGGYSKLLNSRVIWLGDRQEELSGLDFQILYFTDETADRVLEVIEAYKNKKAPDCDYTRGLYFRGVE